MGERRTPEKVIIACCLLGACGTPASSKDPSTVEVAPPDAGAPPASSPRPKPAPPSARTITDGSVGDVATGQPIPPKYLDDARYEARWVADGYPMEGFLLGEPPIWASFVGPLHKAELGPIEDLKAKLAPEALRVARDGAPVVTILIEHAGITTEAGIGVGSSHAELEAAYGPIHLVRNPEEFDSNPTCVATVKAFQLVSFLLASCKQGTPFGPVKRIVVRAP